MRHPSIRHPSMLICATACTLISLLLFSVVAFAQDKPLLSDEIKQVMDAQGVTAAKQRFTEIYPAQGDTWDFDMQGMMTLGSAYIQNGDMERGMAVMEMTSAVSMAAMSDMMNTQSPEMAEIQKAVREAEESAAVQDAVNREQEQKMQERALDRQRGKIRDDLDRFRGLYGDPSDSGRTRTLFVTSSCDGFLVAGAMWADVAPWWMHSASDTVFTYADSFFNLSLEFTIDGSSAATAVNHDIEGLKTPLENLGPLPAEFEDCMERPLR